MVVMSVLGAGGNLTVSILAYGSQRRLFFITETCGRLEARQTFRKDEVAMAVVMRKLPLLEENKYINLSPIPNLAPSARSMTLLSFGWQTSAVADRPFPITPTSPSTTASYQPLPAAAASPSAMLTLLPQLPLLPPLLAPSADMLH